jgi:hypothetical protein
VSGFHAIEVSHGVDLYLTQSVQAPPSRTIPGQD